MEKEKNVELGKRFYNFVVQQKLSQSNVARRLGVSASAISQYKSGTYVGNIGALEAKIEAFLTREDTRASVLDVKVVDIEALKAIRATLSMVHAMKDVGVIVGDAGCGKSTALREYAQRTQSAVFIEVDPSFTRYQLVYATARALGLSVTGSASVMSGVIADYLHQQDVVVIYDEADYLSGLCLDWIRRIVHDKGGCGVVLCGLPRLENVIRTARGDHDQLLSRVGVFLRIPRSKVADTRKLIKSVWGSANKELVTDIHKTTRGSIRRAVKLIQLAGRIASKNKEKIPSLESVQDAAVYLMPERYTLRFELGDDDEMSTEHPQKLGA